MPIADRPLRSRVKQSAQNPAKTVRISSRPPCLHITSRSRAPSPHRHRRVARDESKRGVPSKEPFFLLTLSPFLLASIWRRPRGESTWHHVATRDPRVGAFPTFFPFFLSFLHERTDVFYSAPVSTLHDGVSTCYDASLQVSRNETIVYSIEDVAPQALTRKTNSMQKTVQGPSTTWPHRSRNRSCISFSLLIFPRKCVGSFLSSGFRHSIRPSTNAQALARIGLLRLTIDAGVALYDGAELKRGNSSDRDKGTVSTEGLSGICSLAHACSSLNGKIIISIDFSDQRQNLCGARGYTRSEITTWRNGA